MSNSSNQSSGGGRNRKKRKKSSSSGKKKFDPVAFWGTADSVPTPEGFETTTLDSVAVVNSLGQPPLPGHGAASPHYFKLVYDRSAQLASALAMAGGIDDLRPDEETVVEDDVLDEHNAVDEVTEVSADDDVTNDASIVGVVDESE